MTSDSQHDSASAKRSHLPFEPKKSSKKSGSVTSPSPSKSSAPDAQTPGVPQIVSQRMIRRMALFCGIPTLLGVLTFPASYFVLTRGWLQFPNSAVAIVSLGLFVVGALGLSYGILSASWEEDQPGSKLGLREFRVNFGRLIQERQLQRERKKS